MSTKPDELDDIIDVLVAKVIHLPQFDNPSTYWKQLNKEKTQAKKVIQAHIDKKVNKVLGELNKEIFFSSANPDGKKKKNIILNKRRTIKKLRSEL